MSTESTDSVHEDEPIGDETLSELETKVARREKRLAKAKNKLEKERLKRQHKLIDSMDSALENTESGITELTNIVVRAIRNIRGKINDE